MIRIRRTNWLWLILLLALGAGSAAAQQKMPAPGDSGCAPCNAASAKLPDAPAATARPARVDMLKATDPYLPLTNQQKFHRWLGSTYSPYTFTSALLSTSWAQAVGDWPTYGSGMQGFGKRFGATVANTETAGFFKVFLLPVLTHEDPRFFYSGQHGTVARAMYAATRVFITRKDDGRSAFNTPEIAGTLFTAALTNAYYPRADRGFSNTMSRTFSGITSDASSNVLREFWPDIRQYFRKHEPNRLKKVERRIPKTLEKAAGRQQP